MEVKREQEYPSYNRADLGMDYSENSTRLRLWAPTAQAVRIHFYRDGHTASLIETVEMDRGISGTWVYEKEGDCKGLYYTYQVKVNGRFLNETPDPYARATGANGRRSLIFDLLDTDPKDFEKDRGPAVKNPSDIIVTEISVADATGDASANAAFPGTFKGLTECGLRTKEGYPAGLDYYEALGVTHVQIMPMYDFATINEEHPEKKQYNWGYDPLNYNVPEGSYSTDPFHGEVRVRECKEMIQAFHRKGIGVIMDVVYNHVYDAGTSCFEKTVPGYYFRKEKGMLSNGSGCGNEVASEKPMMRKYIIDSLVYWVREYHVDGFRFDLMGILDIETMNLASMILHSLRPDIILYGEGWSGGSCAYPYERLAMKSNLAKLNGIGVFSDEIRDIVKGGVFNAEDKGFVNGGTGLANDIRFCVVGAMNHPQVDYEKYRGGTKAWAKQSLQVINYLSCHDNLTLWDKLYYSASDATEEERLAMNRLAAAIIFTSQGIPLFLSGEEFCRSKPIRGKGNFSGNSYNLPLSVNSVKYDLISKNRELYEYYRGLISIRKAHRGLRLRNEDEAARDIRFLEELPEGIIAFRIKTDREELLVAYNANTAPVKLELPEAETWAVYAKGRTAGTEVLCTFRGEETMEEKSCLIAVKKLNN